MGSSVMLREAWGSSTQPFFCTHLAAALPSYACQSSVSPARECRMVNFRLALSATRDGVLQSRSIRLMLTTERACVFMSLRQGET